MQGREPTFGSSTADAALALLAFIPLLLAELHDTQWSNPVSGNPDLTDQIREVDLTPPAHVAVKSGA